LKELQTLEVDVGNKKRKQVYCFTILIEAIIIIFAGSGHHHLLSKISLPLKENVL
jgi:hypothetical protein